AIGGVFGAPSRPWEYDPDDPTSNKRLPWRAVQRHVLQWWLFPSTPKFRCEFFRAMSERHRPSKLIKNQNASTINADKLKAKMSETIISSAPPAFSSEYLGDELGGLSSCRSRYATMINRTPINPVKSNQVRFRIIGSSRSMCDVFRVTDAHRTV